MRSQTGLNLLLVVASFALRVRQHSLPLCTWQQQVPGSGQITWLKNLVNRVLNLNSLRDSERLAMHSSLQFVPRAQLRARCVNATRSARCRSRWRHPSCLPVHEWCRHWGPQSSPWRTATALRLQCLWSCENWEMVIFRGLDFQSFLPDQNNSFYSILHSGAFLSRRCTDMYCAWNSFH